MKTFALAGVFAALLFPNAASPAAPYSGGQATPAAQTAPAPAKTEEQPAFSVIGISVHTSHEREASGDGEIPSLWRRMIGQNLVDEIPGNHEDSGLIAVYSDFSKDGYTYTLGTRVASGSKVPDGFVAITVPAGKYAVIKTEQGPLTEILPKAWMKVFSMQPAELGGEHALKVDYEQFPVNMDYQNTQAEIHIGLK